MMKMHRNRKDKNNYKRRQERRTKLAWKENVTFTNQGGLNIYWLRGTKS